jgi:hypothetical protein
MAIAATSGKVEFAWDIQEGWQKGSFRDLVGIHQLRDALNFDPGVVPRGPGLAIGQRRIGGS